MSKNKNRHKKHNKKVTVIANNVAGSTIVTEEPIVNETESEDNTVEEIDTVNTNEEIEDTTAVESTEEVQEESVTEEEVVEEVTDEPDIEEDTVEEVEDTVTEDASDEGEASEITEDDISEESDEEPLEEVSDTEEETTDDDEDNSEQIINLFVDELGRPVADPSETGVVTAGDRLCYVYYDVITSKPGLNADIISVALVDADGNSFYGETTDFSMGDISEELFTTVIRSLSRPQPDGSLEHCRLTATSDEVGKALTTWLYNTQRFGKRAIQFVGLHTEYTFMFLQSLIKPDDDKHPITEMLSNVSHDVNQDIAAALTIYPDENGKLDVSNYVPDMIAGNINKLDFIQQFYEVNEAELSDPNTSLYTAKLAREIHQNMWNIK